MPDVSQFVQEGHKDNYINDKYVKIDENDGRLVALQGIPPGENIPLVRIHKSMIFTARNSSVANLVLDEELDDLIFALVVSFIYELYAFGSNRSHWFPLLNSLISSSTSNDENSIQNKRFPDEIIDEYFNNFQKISEKWNRELNCKFNRKVDIETFTNAANIILNNIVYIDYYHEFGIVPLINMTLSNHFPPQDETTGINSKFLTVKEVCQYCGEHDVCGHSSLENDSDDESESESESDNDSDNETDKSQNTITKELIETLEEETKPVINSDEDDSIKDQDFPECVTLMSAHEILPGQTIVVAADDDEEDEDETEHKEGYCPVLLSPGYLHGGMSKLLDKYHINDKEEDNDHDDEHPLLYVTGNGEPCNILFQLALIHCSNLPTNGQRQLLKFALKNKESLNLDDDNMLTGLFDLFHENIHYHRSVTRWLRNIIMKNMLILQVEEREYNESNDQKYDILRKTLQNLYK